SGVEEQGYEDAKNKVYGTVYYLKGTKVASTCQFWLTDSSRHFLRGALYLNITPNNDSLAPVIDYMQADIEHLVETLRWR
ncbi:MAG: gliding motility protein GldD, partial [Bacteroidales bacterium]|nr:gliding motility protein GldD [Bacteroidales bacterium]